MSQTIKAICLPVEPECFWFEIGKTYNYREIAKIANGSKQREDGTEQVIFHVYDADGDEIATLIDCRVLVEWNKEVDQA